MKITPKSGRCDSSVEARRSAPPLPRRGEGGFSLLMVMFLIGLGFLVMTGVLEYSGASSRVNDRYSEYYTTLAAAEAATEEVIAKMAWDFQSGGSSTVDGSIANYRTLIPTSAEWANYEFADASGNAGQTHVTRESNWGYTNLNWKYSGFFGSNATYRIISNTRNTVSGNSIVAAVKQDIQLARIPLFEFGVFYALDMELNPGLNPGETNFTVTGRVHSNGSIYCEPDQRNVTFRDHVTAAGQIVHNNHPLDFWNRTFGSVTYLGERDSRVTSLNLPIGPVNNDTERHKIIEVPSVEGEPTLLGQQRYYNKADMIILVSDGGFMAKMGAPFFTPVLFTLSGPMTNFVRIDGGTNLFNKREGKYIKYTQLNIGAIGSVTTAMGYVPTSIYIADLRSQTGTQSGVVITNGQTLPSPGLTIATVNPLYVVGHYNAPPAHLGTTNTSATQPASLVADAITIVSSNWDWNDPNYGVDPRNRNAADTTVNAAIIAGICPTEGGAYGGGVENCLRFLEDWNPGSTITFTFNGSIVALFASQFATNMAWEDWWNYMWTDGNGMLPNRRYNFDSNFKVHTKLPPGTPYLHTLIRGEWAITQANSIL